jgi:hypothetical protein
MKGFSLAVSGGQLHSEAAEGGIYLETAVSCSSFRGMKQFYNV